MQTPYLQEAFNGASGALNASSSAVAPTGFTAQFTPQQLQAFQSQLNYGTSNSNIPASSASAGGLLAGSGANAASGGLYGLSNFTPSGGTNSNITAANAYAAGQNIPDQVKAAMLSGEQTAHDVTMPQMDRNAAGSGNINSSANDVQKGIVERGLAQQAAGLSANLQGNAYNTGLGLAESNSEAANTNKLAALMAASSGGTAAANAGVNANTSSIGQQGGLYDIANQGVAGENMAKQADLTNQGQAFNFATNSPYQSLQNFYNLIGANNWGGSSSSTGTTNENTSSTPSFWSTLGGLMSAGGSLASGFTGKKAS